MGDIREVMKEVLGKKGEPVRSLALKIDSPQSQIEAMYYWVLDFINDAGWKTEKLVDNFVASPGSGQFGELGARMGKMQDEAGKWIGGLNQVIKSALNLIYDLKEFDMRLGHYDDASSEDTKLSAQGILALKQIWLDNVDIKRQTGSIHNMANQLGFTTIREVFMIANSAKEVGELDSSEEGGMLNDQVKRVLIPRINEFNKWREYSEDELRKRKRIELNYLRSQIETVKLYSQWMKPYLRAAEDLRQKGFDKNAALVNAFSTTLFELQLLGLKNEKIPDTFTKFKPTREYHSIIVIDMVYRGSISQRVTQQGDYGFARGGRVEATFDAYSVNSEELALVRKKMDESSVNESLAFSMDIAEEALSAMQEDLDYFLKSEAEKEKDKEEKKKKNSTGAQNPFSALFEGLFSRGKGTKKKEAKEITDIKEIKKDSFIEKELRQKAKESASEGLYLVYNIYKKAHGMVSSSAADFS